MLTGHFISIFVHDLLFHLAVQLPHGLNTYVFTKLLNRTSFEEQRFEVTYSTE